MYKSILLLLCLTFGMQHASARTRSVTGGLSPDKTVEVVVSCPTAPPVADDFPEQYHYSVVLRRADTGRVLFEGLDRWQTAFFSDHLRALWSNDGRLVVLTFEGANHTELFRLFAIGEEQTASEVSLPDYIHPVLAALGSESVKSLVAEPVRWTAHTLELSLSGTTAEPRQGGGYDFDFAAELKVQARDHAIKAELSDLHDKPAAPPPQSVFHLSVMDGDLRAPWVWARVVPMAPGGRQPPLQSPQTNEKRSDRVVLRNSYRQSGWLCLSNLTWSTAHLGKPRSLCRCHPERSAVRRSARPTICSAA